MTSAWLNDIPVEDLGLIPARMDGWWSAGVASRPGTPVAGRLGVLLTDRGSTLEPRRLQFVSTLDATSLADRMAKLETLAALFRGVVEVRLADDPDRVAYGHATARTTEFFAPQLTEPEVRVVLDLSLPSPVKWDRRGQIVIATGTAGALVPTGTVPHRGRLWVSDVLGNRTVEVVRADGTVVGMLRLTGVLATGEYLDIQMDRDTPSIEKVSSSGAVRTDVFSWLNTADSFLSFDPDDAPRIRHTGGGSVVCLYRRGWAT